MDEVKEIIEVFSEYSMKSDYYEIFYSEKIGYFAMILDELNGELLDSIDQTLGFFYNQFVIDWKIEKAKDGNIAYSLTELEKEEVFQYINQYTKNLNAPLKQHADKVLYDFLENYGKW